MEILNRVKQDEVFKHWIKVENLSTILDRKDIVAPLIEMMDLQWYNARVEEIDLPCIFNISSDDWRTDGICVADFRVTTAASNVHEYGGAKHEDILNKQKIFCNQNHLLDTKFFLVADGIEGPFTLIEGNRRAVALCRLNKLIASEAFVGVSPSIKNYVWARYTYS